jgi:hypothetical protein
LGEAFLVVISSEKSESLQAMMMMAILDLVVCVELL